MIRYPGATYKRERGFTLIEVAIVVALIGLLLTISLPLFSGARNRAYVAEGRIMLSEWKALMWTCWVEKNFVNTSCDTLAEIGWTSRPTSQVWDTAGVADQTVSGNTSTITLNSLPAGPLGSGKSIQLSLDKSNGKVTETLSGL